MTEHQMDKSLSYSHSQADATYWIEVYRKAFPDALATHDLRHDGWHQRAGRDRAIVLSSGRTIYVDEKVRSRSYNDIAVEVWSVYPEGGEPPYGPRPGTVPGWAREPKDSDWLAYAFEPTRTCHLFPFLGIRAAWEKHAATWIGKANAKEDGFDWVEAKNRRQNGSRYLSISVAVPIPTLRNFIEDALTVTWTAAPE